MKKSQVTKPQMVTTHMKEAKNMTLLKEAITSVTASLQTDSISLETIFKLPRFVVSHHSWMLVISTKLKM